MVFNPKKKSSPPPPPKDTPPKSHYFYDYNEAGNYGIQGTRYLEASRGAGERYAEALGSQQDAMGLYRSMAMGEGPSVAQQQMQAMGDRNMAQQMQLQAMGRGGNVAQQARAATLAGMATQADTRQQLGALRAQEQQAAMSGYAGLASQQAQQQLQQQAMYENQFTTVMDINRQRGRDVIDHMMFLKEHELKKARFRKEQNLDWAKFGLGAAGTIYEGIGSAMGGM